MRQVENRDEKRLGIKFMAAVSPDFFSLLIVGGSQRTGKCMYIKALRNQGYKCGAQSNFTGGTKPRRGQGRERPCFAVCALVCDLSPKAECVPTFTRESERGPFVGEVEKRLGIKFMVAALPDYSLLLVLRVHREPGNVCI